MTGPLWVSEWPGRFVLEIDALRRAGIAFRVDDDQLAEGRLVVDLEWPINGEALRLRARYPESFPWSRPLVYLLAPVSARPRRHCNPIDGELCLLGRDTRHWDCRWTLRDLLERQLEAVLRGGGDEDPQAEPMEAWWNGLSAPDAGYCLVDSDWQPTGVSGGTLSIRYDHDPSSDLRMRACAVAAKAAGFEAAFPPPIPGLKKTVDIAWTHLPEPFVPHANGQTLEAMIEGQHRASPQRHLHLAAGSKGSLHAFSYPMEAPHDGIGTGWLFALVSWHPEAVKRGRRPKVEVLQTLRAGRVDLAQRDPGSIALSGKRIVLAGAGAIGGPIAMGLARRGCTRLAIVDFDHVEPGNSIRWVEGHSSWGLGKAEALKALIGSRHPACCIEVHQLMVGAPDCAVATVLEEADLVIDATAAYAPGMWLGARCKVMAIPLLAAMAWPDADHGIGGGAVALHAPAGGCPRCLEFQEFHEKSGCETPANAGSTLQPVGCAEPTFAGAAHDLEEISLQALRMVDAALSLPTSSVVARLSLANAHGMRFPRWDVHAVSQSTACGCASRA